MGTLYWVCGLGYRRVLCIHITKVFSLTSAPHNNDCRLCLYGLLRLSGPPHLKGLDKRQPSKRRHIFD